MATRKEANPDIVEKLLALANDHAGSVPDYFETLYRQLDERLLNREMEEAERSLQLNRLRSSIHTALDLLNIDGDPSFAEPAQPPITADASPSADDEPEPRGESAKAGEVLFSLSRLDEVRAGEGNTVSFNAIEGGYEIRSTLTHAASSGATGGASIRLSSEIEAAASGKTVIVEVVAQSAQKNGSSEMAIAYSTDRVGNSGWTTVDLGDQFDTFSITYDVPQHRGEPGYDYIGIWADTTGQDKGAIIDSLTLWLANPASD